MSIFIVSFLLCFLTNQSINPLRLNNNNIGDAGATALAEALKINTSITSIWSVDIHFSLTPLFPHQSINPLRLDYNNIGDAGAIALAESLKLNTSITHIEYVDLTSFFVIVIGVCS